MTATTTAARRALWAAPLALGLVLGTAGFANAQSAGCAQKSDQEQATSGPHMAQQADQEQASNGPHLAQQAGATQTYAAQRTAGGGGMPQALIDAAQPHPTYASKLAENDRSKSGQTATNAPGVPCPPKG
jgi:hypothetical protein